MSQNPQVALRPIGTAPQYRLARYPDGLLLVGESPLSEFEAIARFAETLGFDLVDGGIAVALGGVMAFTTRQGGDRWRASIEADAGAAHGDDALLRWIVGPDTGISSMTMAATLSGSPYAATRLRLMGGPCHPFDGDDFGRCVRLLDQVPALRDRLPGMRDVSSEWRGLVDRWGRLEALYREHVAAKEGGTASGFELNQAIYLSLVGQGPV